MVLGPKLLAFLNVPWAGSLVMPWYWQTLLVMGLTTVLWVAVALLTKPDPDELLRKFYLQGAPAWLLDALQIRWTNMVLAVRLSSCSAAYSSPSWEPYPYRC